jgi:peptidoglycan/LPS O-acetylase OafA/YrhL
MVLGALFDRLKITIIAGVMFAILGAGNSLLGLGESDTVYGAPVLLMSFVAVRDDLFALAIIALYIAWSFRGAMALGLLPLIYCTVYLGMRPLPHLKWLPEGDYSYGIYLYGFPIQQALVEVFPTLKVWWALFPTAALVTTALAVISWHFIERPALSLKRIVTPLRAWRTAS